MDERGGGSDYGQELQSHEDSREQEAAAVAADADTVSTITSLFSCPVVNDEFKNFRDFPINQRRSSIKTR